MSSILASIGCRPPLHYPTSQSTAIRKKSGIIISGSMEPGLPGPVRLAECSHCNQRSAFGLSGIDLNRPVPCLACGHASHWTDTVLSNPIEFLERPTQDARVGEIVKFASSKNSSDLSDEASWEVKRVAGRPHDQVEVRDGDLWVNRQRIQKGSEFLQQAILVHTDDLPSCSEWKLLSDSDLYSSHSSHLFHARRWETNDGRVVQIPSPIQDDWWFNQGEQLAPVTVNDIGVVLHFLPNWQKQGELNGVLECWHPKGCQRVVFESKQNRLLWHCEEWSQGTWSSSSPVQEMICPDGWIAIGWIDQRCMVTVGDWTQFHAMNASSLGEAPISPEPSPPLLTETTPLRLVLGASSIVAEKWVIRDTYYRMSSRLANARISPDFVDDSLNSGYMLLGDNVSISNDSRTRWMNGLEAKSLESVIGLPGPKLAGLWRQKGYMRWGQGNKGRKNVSR